MDIKACFFVFGYIKISNKFLLDVNMSTLKSSGVRKIVKKGGSLTVTIPPDAVEFLGIGIGEDVAFIGDRLGNVYMVRQQTLVDNYCSLKEKNKET